MRFPLFWAARAIAAAQASSAQANDRSLEGIVDFNTIVKFITLRNQVPRIYQCAIFRPRARLRRVNHQKLHTLVLVSHLPGRARARISIVQTADVGTKL